MADIEEYTSRLAALLNEMESDDNAVSWISDDITIKHWHRDGDRTHIRSVTLSCADTGDGIFEWTVK